MWRTVLGRLSSRQDDADVADMVEIHHVHVHVLYDTRNRRIRCRIIKASTLQPVGDAFEAYYKRQAIVPPEELPQLLAALGMPLPLDVRVCERAPLATRALDRLSAIIVAIPGAEAQPLSWIDGAWSFTLPAGARPQHSRFLQRQMLRGALERQERASMLPAKLLAPRANHWVLDMCAAPGSKTTQLLEAMERDAGHCHQRGERVGGCLVANDASLNRATALNHRLQAANVASALLLVTCTDARWLDFPAVRFDRILCDVRWAPMGTDGH